MHQSTFERSRLELGISPEKFAAIDLGSNSFRLWIAQMDAEGSLQEIASYKSPVQLAAGLNPQGLLDEPALQRASKALAHFSQVISEQKQCTVRAVATSTFRVAKNAEDLITLARNALGHEIEVLSGLEEGRLIYKGVARQLANDEKDRLVIDIGGGSTECIIGRGRRAKLVETATVGCLSLHQRFFAGKPITRSGFEQAVFYARDHLTSIVAPLRHTGWDYAVGTSGTAKSLVQVANAYLHQNHLDRAALAHLSEVVLSLGQIEQMQVEGLKPERRSLLAAGLALMQALFDEFALEQLRYEKGALRQGALYDLIERRTGEDIQAASVQAMMQRYQADSLQASRVSNTALQLLAELAEHLPASYIGNDYQQAVRALGYAAQLSEIGLAVGHENFNQHGHYILQSADFPGFSQLEQRFLAWLCLGQVGQLGPLRKQVRGLADWVSLLCMRWAAILCRERGTEAISLPSFVWQDSTLLANLPTAWAATHPVRVAALYDEVQQWNEAVPELRVLLTQKQV